MANPIPRFQCWRSFLQKKYLESYNSAATAMRESNHNELIQIATICLQRLRRDELIRVQLPLFFSVIGDDKWLTLLLGHTAGEIEARKAVASASNQRELCQAHYYVSQRYRTLGDVKAADAELTRCLDQSIRDCFEFQFAEAEKDGSESSNGLWNFLKTLPA